MNRTHSVTTLLSLVMGTLVAVLVSVFAISAMDALLRERDNFSRLSSARISRDIVLVREALRVELGVIDNILIAPEPANEATLRELALLHGRSEDTLRTLEQHVAAYGNDKIAPQQMVQLKRQSIDFERMLPVFCRIARMAQTSRPATTAYNPKISLNAILRLIDEQAAILSRHIASAGPVMSELMRVSDIGWHIRIDAGHDRRMMANLIASPKTPSVASHEALARTNGRIEAPWQSIEQSARDVVFPPDLVAAIATANRAYFGDYISLRNRIIAARSRGDAVHMSAQDWLVKTTPQLHSLMQVAKVTHDVVERRALSNLNKARHDLKLALLLMASSIGLACFATGFVLWRIIRPLRHITRAISSSEDRGIDRALALCARGDEMGQFAQALMHFRQGAAERQRLERELLCQQIAMETAQNASRIKSEFLANMSHELRTPLNAVIGFSELMLHKTFGPLAPRYEEYSRSIHQAGNHLLSLVSDILDLAKIEAGRFQADFRTVDMKDCAEDCALLVAPRVRERHIDLRIALPDTPLLVEADARACKQILINLLSNAVKFSRDGGAVHVSLQMLGDQLQMIVRDEGVGIPAEVLSRIGQPFVQDGSDPMLAREGTGLGLALVKALVKEHGGSVQVDSTEHVGTQITVLLPVRQADRAAQAA